MCNIKRRLLKREQEIKILLKNENIDVLFLTKTDTKNLIKLSTVESVPPFSLGNNKFALLSYMSPDSHMKP